MALTPNTSSQTETLMPVISKWGMGGGVATSIFGWLSSSGGAVLIGVAVTILGFWVNFYFQRRRDLRELKQLQLLEAREHAEERRKQELHDLHVARLKAEINEPARQ